MSVGYNDLRIGVSFIYEDQPYEVLEYSFVRMQQRKAVAQVKMKNLINGKVISRNFHQNESFEEVEIVREPVKFLYQNKGQYWFCAKDNPANRFVLTEAVVGTAGQFLKPNTEVVALKFNDPASTEGFGGQGKIINIKAPIKVDLRVKDAPPGIKGDTAQGGTKIAELETGAKVVVPLFVNTGDVVRVNTETGEYVERVEKA